uniref:39S ribosomal protein L41-A, mitochondrial n=1 Tax=Aegilops tauschii subsp. strangulata TaxID=200361 RepID=A0A453P3K5_AEGTS
MPLGLILSSIGRSMRRKRTSSLNILSSKRAPRDYYKGKNCKPTGFHTRKGGYVMVDAKLPRFVVPDLTDFKLAVPTNRKSQTYLNRSYETIPNLAKKS